MNSIQRRPDVNLLSLLSLLMGTVGCRSVDVQPPRQMAAESSSWYTIESPHVQFWGFDNRDPVVEIAGYRMAFQVFTKENTYGLAEDRIEQKHEANRWTVHASQLAWAGQQERAPGTLDVVAEENGAAILLSVQASANTVVRGVKVLLYGLPYDRSGWSAEAKLEPVPKTGVLRQYPSWSASLPVFLLAGADGRGISFSSSDLEPRPKRFAAYPGTQGTTVELIFEQDARRWGPKLAVPAWEIKKGDTLDGAVDARLAMLESKAGLKKWNERTDLPAWTRDISMVVSIHGMHWSGYVFNNYAKALEIVRWVTQRIEPKRVLVFLPGWEGRYYWQYGDYRPEPRLGGPAGFKKMMDGMHAIGVHVMPMFGGNCANTALANYKQFGPDSPMISGTGLLNQGNGPDWDLFRNRDTGWQQWLNPGAPKWQDHLVGQVESLASQFQFDGVFFDTQPNFENDARYSPLEGLRQICQRLRAKRHDLLIATESFNDVSMQFVPVNHTRGGSGKWPGRYVRRWAYLAEGEPSRGSTGVEEDGTVPYNLQELLDNYDWPTASFVDETLEKAPDKVQAVIDRAKSRASGPDSPR